MALTAYLLTLNVLLRVSAINLTTVCNCRECPHMDVRSLGAYSRPMHAGGIAEKGEGHTKLPVD